MSGHIKPCTVLAEKTKHEPHSAVKVKTLHCESTKAGNIFSKLK
jgi:hypothetical protein